MFRVIRSSRRAGSSRRAQRLGVRVEEADPGVELVLAPILVEQAGVDLVPEGEPQPVVVRPARWRVGAPQQVVGELVVSTAG